MARRFFESQDERLPIVGVAVASAVSVSVRIVWIAIAVAVRRLGIEPAETEVAVKSAVEAAMTPAAAPMAAIYGDTRPAETAVRTSKAATKMPAAKTAGMRAAKATAAKATTAMTAAMTAATATTTTAAVTGRERACRHRSRADCYSCNERNNFIPHDTLLTTDRPARSSNARTTRWVAGASAHQDQMTRRALQAGYVNRAMRRDYQSSAIALPCMTSAMRARVACVVSSGSAPGAKKPCAMISWFGCGGAVW